MAANTRAHAPPGFADGELLTPTQTNVIDVGQAGAVRRDSSKGGWKSLPIVPMTTSNVATVVLVHTAGEATTIGNVAETQHLAIVELQDGHAIAGVRIRYIPKVVHVGQPVVLPAIELFRIHNETGVATSMGSATYAWGAGDPGNYDAGFWLTITPAAHTVDLETYRYVLQLTPESGGNSQLALLAGLQANMTLDLAEGGADLSTWLHA